MKPLKILYDAAIIANTVNMGSAFFAMLSLLVKASNPIIIRAHVKNSSAISDLYAAQFSLTNKFGE
ncbi:hypothetical protein TUM17563_03270 [Klebsiella oxytoca]|nr:hypothetical protein TUM17563_03270 [Klebsiella oxytoca]